MIKNTQLAGFRNFSQKVIEFSDKITVIVGPNASGKTNILESVYLLSTGKSFKARIEEESIGYDSEIARINGFIIPSKTKLELILTRGTIGVGGDRTQKVAKKRMLVNGIPKRMIDFAGNFPATLFGPWDMDLVTESPSIRRRFLDNVLSQTDREYRRSILSYEKGLRQRNRLLFRIREEGISRSQLLFWDQLLIKTGNYISQKREGFIEFVNATKSVNNLSLQLMYDKSIISEGRLEQYKKEEVYAATTLVGPHRDDFVFKKDDESRDLAAYGSRGEQRMGVLWLKMAELDYIEVERQKDNFYDFKEESTEDSKRPTLLLDDIFSELDHEHREVVMHLATRQQTIITTADEHFLEGMKKIGQKIVLK